MAAHPKNTVILTHGDVDGVCAAAIAKASYPEAEVEFTNPADLAPKLDSLSGYDCVIILDLGIDSAQKDEAMAAFQKLSRTSSIIYIDHHLRPPGVNERSLACSGTHRTGASTSELAWEFFKPAASHDFIAVLGAVGDYREKTPQIQGLIERYDERRAYPEALFLEWALMVAEDPFKRGVVEELAQGKWPYQMSIMGEEADGIVRRQRTLERYVREKAEKICEHVMLIRDPPFKATGPAATLLTKLDNTDIGIASRREGNSLYLSMRRHEGSDINLASLIEESALKFGGGGGGHKEAAGGRIPVERFDEFLLEIRRRLPEGQLKRIKELDVGSVDKKTIEHKLFKEIIERKRAEEMVKESEEKYRIQFEEALDAIFVADAETGEIIDCNRAALQLVGREKSEIIGQHQKILHPPEEIEGEFSRTFKSHIKEKAGQVLETQVITKKGEIRDVAIKANLFELRGRKMIQGIFRDITERKRVEEALKKTKSRIESILKTAPSGIFTVNLKREITSWNLMAETISGLKAEDVIGKKCAEIWNCSACIKKCGLYAEDVEKPIFGKECLITLSDGRTFLASKNVDYLHDEKGEIIGGVESFLDITERKRAEKELRKSEERYRTLVETLPDVIYSLSEDGIITSLNPAFEKITGWSRAEWLGKPFTPLIHPDDLPLAMEAFQKTLRGETPPPHELRIFSKSGEYLAGEFTSTPQIKDGKVVGDFGIARDITEHKRAEEKLHESEEKFRNLAEQSPNMIFVNNGGRVVYANKRCEEVMGYKREEFYSPDFSFFTLIAPESMDLVKTFFGKHTRGEEVTPYEYTLITKEGKRIEAISTTKLIQYEGEKAILGTITDITEHKKAENRIKLEREVYRSIARAANRSRSVEELCELALKGIQTAIEYDMADVMVYSESEDALFSVAQVGYPEDLYQRTIKRQDLREESKVAAQAVHERKSIYIDDVKTSKLTSYAHDLVAKYDISTLYVVPLFSRGKLQGVLEVLTTGDRKLSKEDREVLGTISEELAGGIAKAKIEEQLVTVKEAFGWLSHG